MGKQSVINLIFKVSFCVAKVGISCNAANYFAKKNTFLCVQCKINK